MYTAEFPDIEAMDISDKTAVDSLFHNFDAYGNKVILFNSIMGHGSTYKYAKKIERCITCKNLAPEIGKTTKGWDFLIKWSNVMMTWEQLSNIVKSFPAQISEYYRGNDIIDYQEFLWWSSYVMNKRKAIIRKVQIKVLE